MSGHSKWDTIKHKKAINDAKKGKSFSKVSALISHAAKQGGGDPEMNPTLRLYITKAKELGFPTDKIEKAIQKGTGEGDEKVIYEEATYEGFGPFGIQVVVDTLTDNKNRTVADLRKLFEEIGGNMAESGAVSWNFETKGYIEVYSGHMEKSPKYGDPDVYVEEDPEAVMLSLMDLDGVLDIEEIEEDGKKGFVVYTKYENFGAVRDKITELGLVIKDAELIKEAKVTKELNEEQLSRANEALSRIEELDDVQNVWSDIE